MPKPEILSRTLPGQPASVPEARGIARLFLGSDPRTGDALVIVSELATNAVLHSRSREEGGVFEIRLELKPDALRIEIVDRGAPTRSAPAGEPDESFAPGEDASFPHGESGRGHAIVYALADDWGHEQRSDRAIWWAELWTDKEQQ